MANTCTKPNKIRLNLALTPRALRIGKRLAKVENRSFSNFLETLIRKTETDPAKANTKQDAT